MSIPPIPPEAWALVGVAITAIGGVSGALMTAWVKTLQGWRVAYGDTGMRNLTRMTNFPDPPSNMNINIRRVGDVVTMWAYALPHSYKEVMMDPIQGFRQAYTRNAVGFPVVSDSGDKLLGKLQIARGWEWKAAAGSTELSYLTATWQTDDPWPTALPGLRGWSTPNSTQPPGLLAGGLLYSRRNLCQT